MADNRQFTDHNEIGGVNVYLEDRKLAESPEKNTVASTDYVLLKDEDNIPRKISKANIMGVVKDALAELLKSNNLGTSVTNVPALNASAFGSATVADLATVLGAIRVTIGADDTYTVQNSSQGFVVFQYSTQDGTAHCDLIDYHGEFTKTSGWLTYERKSAGGNVTITAIKSCYLLILKIRNA